MKDFTIPESFVVGGQEVKVLFKNQEDMPSIGSLGKCNVSNGQILISNSQTDSSKRNTFFHEMIHSILDTAGYSELSGDERLVSTVAALLMEIHSSAVVKDEKKGDIIYE